ncbi:helix-turn-helix domain-containing protein [Nocardioides sp. SOB77]|uniref:Helix-turn-helix domain-containing protein n=1 Tax=Nocardioides oceani TaxID=3058369 RepID=A0ABT8FGH7_9ACTN|nr:PucR family transcriptional regulator [Nocardioides oceani]MDN4173782.1 helix-turn-helix domain-containing protein [Nocardioides oceani]
MRSAQSTAGGASAELAAQAWALLLDQSDTIADSITLALFERDAHLYERMGPELRVDVRESTRVHIRRGLEVLSGQRTSGNPTAIDVWRETGRRRARQGVPLELVLNAYMHGARVLWEALIARSATAPDGLVDDRVLLAAGGTVWSNLDVQNAVLIEAYRREAARLQRHDLQRQQSVLDGLLEGRGADPDFADEARTVLDVGPDDAVACVVALYDDPPDSLGPAEDRLDRLGVVARWHVRSGVYFGLLAGPLPDEPGIAELFAPYSAGRMGVAASPDGIAGFATAFQLATRAAETLPRAGCGVVPVTERLPEVLLAGSPQVAPLLLARTLGPILALPEGQSRMLLDTLAALLRHGGSPTHAAEELYCHRNTVIYRLKQIEQLTGRTLTDPRDKLLLELALIACGSA